MGEGARRDATPPRHHASTARLFYGTVGSARSWPVGVFDCGSPLRVTVSLCVTLHFPHSSSPRPPSWGRAFGQHELPTSCANLPCRCKPATPRLTPYVKFHREGPCERCLLFLSTTILQGACEALWFGGRAIP